MNNPYANQHFVGFFWVLLKRLFGFVTGGIHDGLVSDEIQIGVLMCLAISGALVGSFLVLRQMTMLANAISHTLLFGIVIVYFFLHAHGTHTVLSFPILGCAALITGLLTALLTECLTRVFKLQEDASIGLVFTLLFAIGIILITLYSRDAHIGVELVMGNVDALQKKDLGLAISILLTNLVLFILFFKEQTLTTFDRNLSYVIGFSPLLFNYLLMIQTAGTVVGAFRAVGMVMILAFLVIPVITARLVTKRLSRLIVVALSLGCLSAVVGVALSRHFLTIFHIGLSTGGLVVCVLILFFSLGLIFSRFRRKKMVSLD